MNFFEVVFWMGVLCVIPVVVVAVYDAIRSGRLSPVSPAAVPSRAAEVARLV